MRNGLNAIEGIHSCNMSDVSLVKKHYSFMYLEPLL